VLKRGYAILFDDWGNVLRSARDVAPGARLHARLADGELPLHVDDRD
jgi:exodeoxyribonuclease VII large subunit